VLALDGSGDQIPASDAGDDQMSDIAITNFTVLDSVYGRFILNRHCAFQAEALVKTGRPHIDDELKKIMTIVNGLPHSCVVVDAGANIGLVSIPIAQAVKARGGIVHAFEAQRMMFYALCGAAALNDLENLWVWHRAVGAAPGTISVPRIDYAKPQDFGMVSLVGPPGGEAGETVDLVAVDTLALPRLDFLKIDVEGMEISVLQGARVALQNHLPWCWIEYWLVDREEIKAQFAGLDYKFYVMDNLNMLCAPAERLAASNISIRAPEA
jgi:FkbM family methyltransferase